MPSLAARCTACGTVFRVVQDQLRVAGGLVRCGRCGEVFNAAQALIDLDTAAAVPPPAELQAQATQPPPTQQAPPIPPPPPPTPSPAPPPADPPAPLAAIESDPALGWADDPATATAPPAPPAESDAPEADPRAEPDDKPSFVRSAERAQRWRRPRVRAALGAAAVLGAVALVAQAVHSYRDPIAARYPGSRPALEAACSVLGCKVEAVRTIDRLAVESSGLVRVEKSNVYKLQLSLRNRGDIPLALPAFDLTLSDGAGKPVARRVLRAADLGVNDTTLAAGRELTVQATLQAATDPVVGYTVELFYP